MVTGDLLRSDQIICWKIPMHFMWKITNETRKILLSPPRVEHLPETLTLTTNSRRRVDPGNLFLLRFPCVYDFFPISGVHSFESVWKAIKQKSVDLLVQCKIRKLLKWCWLLRIGNHSVQNHSSFKNSEIHIVITIIVKQICMEVVTFLKSRQGSAIRFCAQCIFSLKFMFVLIGCMRLCSRVIAYYIDNLKQLIFETDSCSIGSFWAHSVAKDGWEVLIFFSSSPIILKL